MTTKKFKDLITGKTLERIQDLGEKQQAKVEAFTRLDKMFNKKKVDKEIDKLIGLENLYKKTKKDQNTARAIVGVSGGAAVGTAAGIGYETISDKMENKEKLDKQRTAIYRAGQASILRQLREHDMAKSANLTKKDIIFSGVMGGIGGASGSIGSPYLENNAKAQDVLKSTLYGAAVGSGLGLTIHKAYPYLKKFIK